MSSGGIFDLSKLASELQSLEEHTAQPDFWKDPQAAARVGRRKASLERDIQRWREIERKLDDLQAMADLAEESGDGELQQELAAELTHLDTTLRQLRVEMLLSGELDANNAIVAIHLPRAKLRTIAEEVSELRGHL